MKCQYPLNFLYISGKIRTHQINLEKMLYLNFYIDIIINFKYSTFRFGHTVCVINNHSTYNLILIKYLRLIHAFIILNTYTM